MCGDNILCCFLAAVCYGHNWQEQSHRQQHRSRVLCHLDSYWLFFSAYHRPYPAHLFKRASGKCSCIVSAITIIPYPKPAKTITVLSEMLCILIRLLTASNKSRRRRVTRRTSPVRARFFEKWES